LPVLIDEAKARLGNPWGVSFMAMFHMSNDSGLFRTVVQLREAGYARDGSDWVMPKGAAPRQGALALSGGRDGQSLPLQGGSPGRTPERYVRLYEGKMIQHYDHRHGDAAGLTIKPVNAPLPRPTLRRYQTRPRAYPGEQLLHKGSRISSAVAAGF
jgi:hypothetical protein